MTMKMMADIVAEFKWPHEYKLEDDLPDGIILSFPRSHFYFSENRVNGGVRVLFFTEDTGQPGLELGHALFVFWPEAERVTTKVAPGVSDEYWPFPSEENTRDGIRDACRIILARLRTVIDGDFSWVGAYLKIREGWKGK